MKTWLDPKNIVVPDDLAQSVGGHGVVAASLARRGFSTAEAARRFLDPAYYVPAAAGDLPDMDKAVSRVQRAINDQETILVWGDFDVDGQTATALLVSALGDLGAKVAYHIPNRFSEGHGIHLPTLKPLLDGGIGLLLSCDTGIAAHESIAYAQGRGIDVVVTDHHTLPETLPVAQALVNPMRLNEGHALRELPGVGTAYQLIRALYGATPSDHLLDLVAVGIVADVMVLVDDTRYWLQRGLDVLRAAERPGLRAIMERAEIIAAEVDEEDIGFGIAPRLNALGRLADANPAVALLTSHDPALINEWSNTLEGLNQERRHWTRQVYAAVQQRIEQDPALLRYAALVVDYPGWPAGIVGIVASRLAEEYQRPVLLLSTEKGLASGSARSVAGCNITQAIGSQAHLLESYGGHSMAAGLRLKQEDIYEFRRGLSLAVREMLGSAPEEAQLEIDAYLGLGEITLALAQDIARLGPFGNGNPALKLATRNLRISSARTMGSRGDHLDLRVEDETGEKRQVKWWFGDESLLPQGRFDLAFTLRANSFRGKREVMIQWLDARPAAGETVFIGGPAYEVIDYRQHPDPAGALQRFLAENPGALVWREGDNDLAGVDRYHLSQADTLVVWTSPPGLAEWQAALDTTKAKRLVLFGAGPEPMPLSEMLKQVAGMVKYALNQKNGDFTLVELAAAMAQRESMLRAALEIIAAQGSFDLSGLDWLHVPAEAEARAAFLQGAKARLQALYQETASYRRYWREQRF